MSEFVVEVERLDTSAKGGDKANKTMMIDRSELANAAYLGGDMDKLQSQSGHLAVGAHLGESPGGRGATGRHLSIEDDQPSQGIDALDDLLDIPAVPPTPPPPPPAARKPERPATQDKVPEKPHKKPTRPGPLLTVTLPDGGTKEIVMTSEVVLVAEDGSTEDTTEERVFANHAYLLFVKTSSDVVVTAAGDRRLVQVNGANHIFARLNEGDTIELGSITINYRR
jgi:hypothetical protein